MDGQRLEVTDLSIDKAKLATDHLSATAKTSLAASPNETYDDLRAALHVNFDEDAAGGKLSQDDADNIEK